MSSVFLKLPDLYNSYKEWVIKNPESASGLESTAKWLSIYFAGKSNNSLILSELVYCLSNLITFYNDRIICKSLNLESYGSKEQIKIWLTIIDYSQVFLELSSKKLWGNRGKWLVIVCIQAFKCVARLILLYHHKDRIIESPPIPNLKRQNCNTLSTSKGLAEDSQVQIDSMTFSLKRSGKLIRKVDSSPPIAFRSWKPIQKPACENHEIMNDILNQRQLVAETIYVLKPLVHLGSLAYFGKEAWKPWILSFFMDVVSLQLYRSCETTNMNSLSKQQMLQISRRSWALLLYLLRSPFYDRYSENKLLALFNALSNHVPLAGIICKPVAQYMPSWQRIYFYNWSC